jgi:hypothetical protein
MDDKLKDAAMLLYVIVLTQQSKDHQGRDRSTADRGYILRQLADTNQHPA